MPSLRDRRSDILQLAECVLQFYSGHHGLRSTGFTEDGILKLQRYSFPGNVRELEHVVERPVLKASGRATTSDITLLMTQSQASHQGPKNWRSCWTSHTVNRSRHGNPSSSIELSDRRMVIRQEPHACWESIADCFTTNWSRLLLS